MKYIKYKEKYINLCKNQKMLGGSKYIVHEIKIKMVEFIGGQLYALNNIDSETLDEDSEFLIGSVTKLFTIVVLLLLNEQGLINVNNPIGPYLDNEELSDTKIIDIINHKSGIKNNTDTHNYELGSEKKFANAIEVYSSFAHETLLDKSKFGKYSYSNIGYICLGALIEKITSKNLEKIYKKFIFKPLKLKHTDFSDTNITLYRKKTKFLDKFSKNERTFACSAGQLKSSPVDLIEFSNFPQLLNSESKEIIKTLYIFKESEDVYEISHNGGIHGGGAKVKFVYNKDWDILGHFIQLKTIDN